MISSGPQPESLNQTAEKITQPKIYHKIKKRLFFVGFLVNAIVLFLLVGAGFAAEYSRYDIEATIDVAHKRITAHQKVIFTNTADRSTSDLFFHIYPNRKYTAEEKNFMLRYTGYFKIDAFPEGFQLGRMEIHSIASGEKKLPFAVEGEDETLLKISLDHELKPQEEIALDIDFTVSIPHAYGRFGWHERMMALSRWYPILSVFNKNGWNNHPFYPFHRPFFSEAAFYTAKITVPEEQKVIHSGYRKEETTPSAGWKTLRIESSLPIREFSLALSPDYRVYETLFDKVKIKSFYFSGQEERARKAAEDARDLMKYYTEHFGPYPYEEFSIAPVYLGYGGEQMSNMIFIDTRVYLLPKFLDRYFDFFISHETGHQWFYNILGIDEFTQMWLEEGINSYFLLEYLESKYGKEAMVMKLPKSLEWLLPNFSFRRSSDFRYKLIARTKLDHPILGKLSSFSEPSTIFSLTYGKGSSVVHMLRALIGQEAFQKTFARIFKEFAFKNIDIEDFIRVTEEESGKNLKWFFDEWLRTNEKCDYAVSKVEGSRVTLEKQGDISMPVEIEVYLSNGQTKRIVSEGKESKEEITIDGKELIRSVRLDPDKKLLDIDRTNDSWPRKINTKFVPLYVGLYDIPLFLPEDSYNIVIGPELANSGLGVKASLQKPYDQVFYSASDYEFGEELVHSRLGYELHNVFHSLATVGFELFNTDDLDGGQEDLAGGKAYFRQELWPASYGLTDINDHFTLYLIRSRSLNNGFFISSREDSRNVSYLKKDEAIVGAALHLGKEGPYPDPVKGYQLDAFIENSGHFLGATQYFYRGAVDYAIYQPVTTNTKMALRFKYGWGYPTDKNLYEQGGMDGLRGYDRKTLRGAQMALGSIEYRFPLIEKMGWYYADHIVGLESLGAVVFFDGGQNWHEDFEDTQFKKDAGLGLRFTVSLGSFLEKIIVRFDAAQAINEPKEPTRFWFGVGHSF